MYNDTKKSWDVSNELWNAIKDFIPEPERSTIKLISAHWEQGATAGTEKSFRRYILSHEYRYLVESPAQKAVWSGESCTPLFHCMGSSGRIPENVGSWIKAL